MPFENTPYQAINSIGKQWIRRFALALSKETLGNVRSKIGSIPIPGDSVTLDGPALLSQSQTEQEKYYDASQRRYRHWREQTNPIQYKLQLI
mgnify:CR=1 FL=1